MLQSQVLLNTSTLATEGLLGKLTRLAAANRRGRVATYIPELATTNPNYFGVATCSTNGTIVQAGDAQVPFTIQSVCKPILYAAALHAVGVERVHQRVGVEPTGESFDSFTRLESGTNRPRNPLVNAGAIALVDLLIGLHAGSIDPNVAIMDVFSQFLAPATVEIDLPIFLSERRHGRRNRVIAHLLKYHGMITGNVDTVLDAYYTACSVRVTCRDLATMAAILANGGVHPTTRSRVVMAEHVPAVLTLMTTCGMYDASGRFAKACGLPAKSGVSGGIMAVHPSCQGIGVFSPRLDADGNSVTGWRVLREYSRTLKSHTFDAPRRSPSGSVRIPETRDLEMAWDLASNEPGGMTPAYLPPVNEEAFACAICTVDGEERSIGDVDLRVALQSGANPLAYGLALSTFGNRPVEKVVGVEPSGNPFDAILFDRRYNKPYNPLSNAGALAIAGLSAETEDANRLKRWLTFATRLTGRNEPLTVNIRVLEAEYAASDRNRAMANLLVELGILQEPDPSVDLYLRQCATTVTCVEAARIGATLASGGKQPVTGERVLSSSVARHVTTVMYTCGMHDESGQFAFDVGIPSKSGNSGLVLSVVPGIMGIAIYSPLIDAAGTSVRGRLALRSLAQGCNLAIFR